MNYLVITFYLFDVQCAFFCKSVVHANLDFLQIIKIFNITAELQSIIRNGQIVAATYQVKRIATLPDFFGILKLLFLKEVKFYNDV